MLHQTLTHIKDYYLVRAFKRMDKDDQTQKGSGFSADFLQVRLHTHNIAVRMNHDLQAKAFTYGKNIFFNSRQYQLRTVLGQRLTAHELSIARKGDGAGKQYNNGLKVLKIHHY